MSLRAVPLDLHEANELVLLWHRHHKPARGQRFSVGAVNDATGDLVGAAICGRPVSRGCDPRRVLEVTRLVTNGYPNACSFLYGVVARAAKELGYERIQTYTLAKESGSSLKGAGWVEEGLTAGGDWVRADGARRRKDQPSCRKLRWAKVLAFKGPEVMLPDEEGRPKNMVLFPRPGVAR